MKEGVRRLSKFRCAEYASAVNIGDNNGEVGLNLMCIQYEIEQEQEQWIFECNEEKEEDYTVNVVVMLAINIYSDNEVVGVFANEINTEEEERDNEYNYDP